MTTNMLYPKDSDTQTTSHKVGDVYGNISEYCNLFQELIHKNHGHSRYAVMRPNNSIKRDVKQRVSV
jgi:hypothetical protein